MYTQNFQRRSDLTLSIRLFIVYLVICQNRRGLIPKLCDKYSVSRAFIYDLRQKYIDFVNEEGVDLQQGRLKELSKTIADFEVALQYLKTLDKTSINKQVKTIVCTCTQSYARCCI